MTALGGGTAHFRSMGRAFVGFAIRPGFGADAEAEDVVDAAALTRGIGSRVRPWAG